jgi:GT2 family glycosyltransferase
MLEDIAIEGEYFDEDFFAYREDADLAWRAQLLGWKAVYTPFAVATHRRLVLPERRRSLSPTINMHSVKNRFLLRLKNQTLTEFLALFFPSVLRDLTVVGYVFLFEWSSLPGLWFVLRNLGKIGSRRRRIMSMRKVRGRDMLLWFSKEPKAFDLEGSEALTALTVR